MPHAAIYWCNPVQIRAKSPVPKFQCRTRQFTGAMEKITMINGRELFQCRTRQICWCNFLLPSHAALYGVSMPHAANLLVQFPSPISCSAIWRFNAARGNLLVQCEKYRKLVATVDVFQCRTRQFTGAICLLVRGSKSTAKFQCRTRQFSGAIRDP